MLLQNISCSLWEKNKTVCNHRKMYRRMNMLLVIISIYYLKLD